MSKSNTDVKIKQMYRNNKMFEKRKEFSVVLMVFVVQSVFVMIEKMFFFLNEIHFF